MSGAVRASGRTEDFSDAAWQFFGTFLFSDRDAGDRKLICGRATRSKEWKPVWDHSFFCAVNIPEMLGWAL
ncbi:hypothetical protein, partial [Parablautia intestinalis]|uniref:hypothetical protein n=1 Tax=Parablautia intestinalis TaxID=2320100 RepID=UPI00256ECB54